MLSCRTVKHFLHFLTKLFILHHVKYEKHKSTAIKKFLFALIAAFASFSIPADSGDETISLEDVVYIRDADTGKLAYVISMNFIVDTKNVYIIDGKYVKDVLSGEKIYELYGRYVKRCKDGKRVFIIGKGYIRDFNGGKKIYTIEGKSNYKINRWEEIYCARGKDGYDTIIYDAKTWEEIYCARGKDGYDTIIYGL